MWISAAPPSPYVYPHISDFFVDYKWVDIFGHSFGKFQALFLAFWYWDEECRRKKYELELLLRSVQEHGPSAEQKGRAGERVKG